MALYFCSRCEILRDKDTCVCSPDPKDPLGLICENCMPEERTINGETFEEWRKRMEAREEEE